MGCCEISFSKVLELDELNPKANYDLARILLKKTPKKAKSHLTKALKLDKAYSRHISFMQEYGNWKKILKATHHYNKSIDYFTENPLSLYHLGKLQFIDNKFEEEKNLRLSINLDPQNAESHYYLAKILTKDEDASLAKKHFIKRWKSIRSSPMLTSTLHSILKNLGILTRQRSTFKKQRMWNRILLKHILILPDSHRLKTNMNLQKEILK